MKWLECYNNDWYSYKKKNFEHRMSQREDLLKTDRWQSSITEKRGLRREKTCQL
jgi:hypothetical protein